MRIFRALLGVGVAAGAAACTSPYQAPAGANPEDIFREACLRCHAPLGDGSAVNGPHFTLAEDEMNPEYIAHRIRSGTMGMPRFPNIQGEELEALAAWVLGRSVLEAN